MTRSPWNWINIKADLKLKEANRVLYICFRTIYSYEKEKDNLFQFGDFMQNITKYEFDDSESQDPTGNNNKLIYKNNIDLKGCEKKKTELSTVETNFHCPLKKINELIFTDTCIGGSVKRQDEISTEGTNSYCPLKKINDYL